jgi:hypothetical protein
MSHSLQRTGLLRERGVIRGDHTGHRRRLPHLDRFRHLGKTTIEPLT